MWQQLPKPHFNQPFLLPTEVLYPLIIILISLFIFFRTKELYSLSKYKGIYFFRQTFLFFALAYLFRFLPVFFRLADFSLIHHRIGFVVGLYFFGFASTMALLSLARSLIWKEVDTSFLGKPYLYYVIALLLPASILFFSLQTFLWTQFLLLIIVSILSYVYHTRSKKRKRQFMYYNYLLLALVWTLNIAAVTLPPFRAEFKLVLYIISLTIFIVMLYRVVLKMKVR